MRIATLLASDFEDSEFRVPHDAFRQAGHEVVLVGEKAGQTVEGDKGKEKVRIDLGIDDARAETFDALFLPGGYSPDKLRADGRMVGFVQRFRDKPIFAICHGPQLLITADMVRGRTMTSWKTVQIDLRNAGANVLDREVVVDRNLVTSRRPDDLEAFSRESLSLLSDGASAAEHAPAV